MSGQPRTAWLANIRLHPIKALDPVQVKEARIGPGGGLELDRAWALYSADGERVNGKRTAAVHLIRAAYASVSQRAVVPLQDVFSLGSAARMNHPGLAEGNWIWRAREEDFTPERAARLKRLGELTGRT